MRRIERLVCTLALLAGCKTAPKPHEAHLMVNVLYGDPSAQHTDSRSRQLLATLPDVPKAGYTLRDEAEFHLERDTVGRLQMPDGSWLALVPQGLSEQGHAKLSIELDDVQLKTHATLAPGTTLAIGGAPYGRGYLLVAIRNL